MNTKLIEQLLLAALYAKGEELNITALNTFDELGIMTNNAGLVLCVDGKEFQLTIVRSK